MSGSAGEKLGFVLIDGAGDRYEVVGWNATFMVRPLDREGGVIPVSVGTLRDLGVEWDGRTLKEVGR